MFIELKQMESSVNVSCDCWTELTFSQLQKLNHTQNYSILFWNTQMEAFKNQTTAGKMSKYTAIKCPVTENNT